jgi:hypothetical protein
MAPSLLVKIINFNVNAKDSVGTRTFFVCIGLSNFSNLTTEFKDHLHVFCRLHLFARQLLNNDLSLLVTNFKIALVGVQQVIHTFIVDLHVVDANLNFAFDHVAWWERGSSGSFADFGHLDVLFCLVFEVSLHLLLIRQVDTRVTLIILFP